MVVSPLGQETGAPAVASIHALPAVIDLVRHGQDEGVFTADLDAKWIENTLWSLVFAGCEESRSGTAPRHVIAANIIRTLEGGIVR
ncbi:hypothetical protein GCM10027590_65880 [Nocardiopsis nanhaiensis]